MKKRKHPKFKRQNQWLKQRVRGGWRKPRGIDNKQRVQKAGEGALPRVGWRNARAIRGKHPSGFYEKIVHNPVQLSAVNRKTHAVRIASKVGGKKRAQIIKKAAELKLKIL